MSNEQDKIIQKIGQKRREALYWALVLIWAGVVFGADNLGVLPHIGRADAWNWLFFGAGAFGLVGSLIRSASPDKPDAVASLWNFVWAGIMLILGLSPLAPVSIGMPLILLLVGVALLETVNLKSNQSLRT